MRYGMMALALAGVAGCAASKAQNFSSVSDTVRERLGAEIRWSEPDAEPEETEVASGPLTVERAVQVALQNNAALQAEFEELGMARALTLSEQAIENPRVGAEILFPPGDEGHTSIELELTQSLTSLLFAPRRAGIGSASVEAAKLRAAESVLDLAHRVRTSFYAHRADLQRLELWQTALAASDASSQGARALYEAGNISALEVYREEAERERLRMAVAEAELRAAESRAALDAELGLWGEDTRWTIERGQPLPGDLPPDEELEAAALRQSLGLAAARSQLAAAGARASLSRWQGLIPDLEVGVAAHREEEEGWAVGPIVELEVPLFNQGNGEVASSRAEVRKLQQEYRRDAVRLRSVARAVSAKLRAAEARERHYRAVVLPLQAKILDESRRRVNAMLSGFFELLQAKRDQLEAARDHVTALEEYWIARAELNQLLAGGRIEPADRSSPGTAPVSGGRSGGGH